MNSSLKQVLTHLAAIAIMLVAACLYFSPALSGDIVYQGDMQKAEAMAHQQKMVADSTGTIPNWNPSMFSGMPGYQTAVEPQRSVFTALKSVLIMRHIGWERHIGILWLYLIGFYIALIAMGCSPWLALLGAISFGLGSYNIIIVEAGHITKAWAMAMIAPMLAGMILSLRSVQADDDKKWHVNWKRLTWGAILFTLATGLQITFNHIQITFYTVIAGVIIGLTYLVYALKDKWFKQYLVTIGILLAGCLFAVGGNYRHLTVNQEYAKVTMRGGSEITVTPKDLGMQNAKQSEATQSGGLDINYAFSWSYGIGETYTLLVPGAMGGGSGERVADDSEWARLTGQTKAPLYWGEQPFTSGPVYFGAIVVFLFLLGCIIVKGPERWWLIISTLLAIVMSWGYHFNSFNEFLFNNLPLYNKFRTPSMSLVLANTTMVIMAVLAVKAVIDNISVKSDKRSSSKPKSEAANNTTGAKTAKIYGDMSVDKYDKTKRMNRALFWAGGIVGVTLLVGMIIAKTRLSFTGGAGDAQYQNMLGDQWSKLQQMLIDERFSLFMRDSLRSLGFVVLAFLALALYINKAIKKSGILIALLSVLVLLDLWAVDRRYLNKDNFIDPSRVVLRKNATEHQLDATASLNGDKDYRVYDLTINTFNDSRPSAFNNEIGGYSAAKLRRYQDLIDFYLGSQKLYDYVNSCQIGVIANDQNGVRLAVQEPYPVLDMLNARYLMLNLQQNQPTPIRRTTALGNCWFVEEIKQVADANAEIMALDGFDPYKCAVIDQSKFSINSDELVSQRDSSESITLIHTYPQTPDHLTYKSHTSHPRLALFSEIYYEPDWRAYIDGKPAEYIRADYVLRAIVVPAGDHTIEFVNEAPTLHRHDTVTLIISLIMLAVMSAALVLVYKKKDTSNQKQ